LDPTSPDSLEKMHFLRAVTIVCDGMHLLATRYSNLASVLAEAEPKDKRREELQSIADTCRQVPAHPPRTLQEALQAIWFGQVALFLEENTSGTSPGRIDQYLYPFFSNDLANGSLTVQQAQELLYCFLLKFNEIPWLLSQFATRYFAGYMPFMNIVVGGQIHNGKDASNQLTYLILDCVKNLHMYQPSLAARIHSRSPQEFLMRVGDVVREGLGFPALHFDDTTIKMLLSSGISLEDARDYCVMGCVEPYIHGKLSRWTSACYTNFPVAIEFALFNGWHAQSSRQLGLSTGDPAKFHTFDEFESAVKRQLVHLIDIAAMATNVAQVAHKKYLPKPVSSGLVEGCVESGKDIMAGGAKYNAGPGVIFVGLADYANSMAAVRKLVYEDKVFSMEHLCNALKHNFVGYDNVKQACLKAPKYGNDDDYVDYFAVDVLDFVATELHKHKTLYARLELGTLSVTTNVPQGLVIGALPSGRPARSPLADGVSPAQGTDRRGPTAAIKSVDKLNQANTSVGTLFNMAFSPHLLADERGLANFAALVRAHNNLGGAQIQFNCISKDTLLEAQEFPERYRNLVIRVSGYSAFFTELCKEVQDDIISRTLQTSW
ncbi:MAG: hypothetical protein HY711_05140, partial [Candidatus Melainabacteria bacterium]|nr:hypothetical protein [Candidatus Melainabacteria bacterium]